MAQLRQLINPKTLLVVAWLPVPYALLAYIVAVIEVVKWWQGSHTAEFGEPSPSLFGALMTAVLATLFVSVSVFVFRFRNRLKSELDEEHARPVSPKL